MNWIQEQVYAIGWLVVIGGVIYLIIKIISSKEDTKKENETLRNYSDKCKNLPFYGITYEEREKKIKEILSNSEEREKARNKYRDEQHAKVQDKIKKRKLGYKYEIDIYEIFYEFEHESIYVLEKWKIGNLYNVKRAPNHNEMIKAIQKKYSINSDKANSILEIWRDNWLVNADYIFSEDSTSAEFENYRIGQVLTFHGTSKYRLDEYKITNTDLTYEQWKAIKKYKKDILNIFSGKDSIPAHSDDLPIFENGKYVGVQYTKNGIIDIIENYYSITQKEACDIFYQNWLEYDLVKEIRHNNSVLADAYEVGDIIKFQTSI
jgi:hypothetical protein